MTKSGIEASMILMGFVLISFSISLLFLSICYKNEASSLGPVPCFGVLECQLGKAFLKKLHLSF